jgi:hypothetical protein
MIGLVFPEVEIIFLKANRRTFVLLFLGDQNCESSSVVEHQLPKLRVVGSNPVSRSMIKRELELVLTLFIFNE